MNNESKINPSHYQLGDGIQVIDITEKLGFLEGNVVKYVCRAGKKDGEDILDDLYKARWYLNRQIEIEETLRGRQETKAEAPSSTQHTS
jgi:hypothetical protein